MGIQKDIESPTLYVDSNATGVRLHTSSHVFAAGLGVGVFLGIV
jgi:hypothetical protein